MSRILNLVGQSIYFVIKNNERVMYLVCYEYISVFKKYNIKPYCNFKHKVKYDALRG